MAAAAHVGGGRKEAEVRLRLTAEQKAATRRRFEDHRRAWQRKPALRALYTDWYGQVRARLPSRDLGPWVELGSGPGFARDLIPGIILSDVVAAPWHDQEAAAEWLPFADGSLGALVLFDVLHHLASPAAFLAEATRVLRVGGRIVLCEPYVSPLSYPVYKLLHDEKLDLWADPLVAADAGEVGGRDPFDANQAIPTLLFCRPRRRAELERRYPQLSVTRIEHLAGPSYPASGGFSGADILPAPLWSALRAVEGTLPPAVFRFIGFRILITVERCQG